MKDAFVKIDGVSYNASHAKRVGKSAFAGDKALHHHHQHLAETERSKQLETVYDQLVAQLPTSTAPAPSLSASKN